MSSTGVYDAERAVFGRRFEGNGHHLRLAQAQALVVAELGPTWTVQRTRSATANAGSYCYPTDHRIALSPDAGLPLVLHEIAHGLVKEPGHGLAFQRAYLELVGRHMGPVWERKLARSLIRRRCRGYVTLAAEYGVRP